MTFRILRDFILSVFLLCGVAYADSSIQGQHVTMQTDGTLATGEANIITQNAGPIQFFTNNTKRFYISAAGDLVSTGGAITGAVFKLENAAWLLSKDSTTGTLNLIRGTSTDHTEIASKAAKTIILSPESDANRKFTFDATSDIAHTLSFGDAGTTAVQTLWIGPATADGDDDAVVFIHGGGIPDSGARGASIRLPGEESSGGADIEYTAGAGDTHVFKIGSTTEITFENDKIGFTGANAYIYPGSTTFAIKNAAESANNILITDAGIVTIRSALLPLTDGNNTDSNLGSGSFGFKNIYLSDATNRSTIFASNSLYISYPASQSMFFRNASTDMWQMTSVGALVSSNAAIDSDITAITGSAPKFIAQGDADTGYQISIVNTGADTTAGELEAFKTRSSAGDANTIVNSGDTIFRIRARGADGATYQSAGAIVFTVDGTPGSSDMPGAIDFQTSPDGSATLASVLKLSNDRTAQFTGQVKSSFATDLGWAVVAGANTACNTTCTSACVFGQETTSKAILACTDATADTCLCAGAS